MGGTDSSLRSVLPFHSVCTLLWNKTDPSVSTLAKVAKALGAQLSELFADDLLRDVNSYDKSVMEKITLIDSLDEDEKKSIFKIIDRLISKKKMKDSLAKALAQ